jgi:hypothetical protein
MQPTPDVETSNVGAPSMPARPVVPPRPRFQSAESVPRALRTDGSAISQAVNEVMQIVASLKQTLEQMEEVLELVELAERQKLTDEREIESLLRALRQFQSRGEPPERQERFNRPERPNRPERGGRPDRSNRPPRLPQPGRTERPEPPQPSENPEPPQDD